MLLAPRLSRLHDELARADRAAPDAGAPATNDAAAVSTRCPTVAAAQPSWRALVRAGGALASLRMETGESNAHSASFARCAVMLLCSGCHGIAPGVELHVKFDAI